jgi:hypothetical protein
MAEERGGDERQPTQEELQVALEEELRKVRVQDLLVQSVASIVNLTARRIGKEDERDLEQARIGIDAVRALVGLLPDEPAKQVREALSQLQLLYAQTAGEAGREATEREAPEEAPEQARGEGKGPERPSRLWTPPGST